MEEPEMSTSLHVEEVRTSSNSKNDRYEVLGSSHVVTSLFEVQIHGYGEITVITNLKDNIMVFSFKTNRCDCCMVAFSKCEWANSSASSWICMSQENACCHTKNDNCYICYKHLACKHTSLSCNSYRQCFNTHCFLCFSKEALKNMDKVQPKLRDTGRGIEKINYEDAEDYSHLSCG